MKTTSAMIWRKESRVPPVKWSMQNGRPSAIHSNNKSLLGSFSCKEIAGGAETQILFTARTSSTVSALNFIFSERILPIYKLNLREAYHAINSKEP